MNLPDEEASTIAGLILTKLDNTDVGQEFIFYVLI